MEDSIISDRYVVVVEEEESFSVESMGLKDGVVAEDVEGAEVAAWVLVRVLVATESKLRMVLWELDLTNALVVFTRTLSNLRPLVLPSSPPPPPPPPPLLLLARLRQQWYSWRWTL